MIKLHIAQLSKCCSTDRLDQLEQIPAMQRRRLSSIAKLALNNALQCKADWAVDYIVWTSQYGDEQKTLKILADILQDQGCSPTLFATSVHNAVSGLYSILCADATTATSLAASWSEALLEAYSYLKTHITAKRVLVLYYDEALPEIYAEYQAFEGFSLAAIVSLVAEQNTDQTGLVLDPSQIDSTITYHHEAQHFYDFWCDAANKQQGAWQKC